MPALRRNYSRGRFLSPFLEAVGFTQVSAAGTLAPSTVTRECRSIFRGPRRSYLRPRSVFMPYSHRPRLRARSSLPSSHSPPFPNHRTWSTVDLDARGPPPGQLHRRYGEDDRPPTPSPRPVRYRAVENGSSSLFAPRETLPGRALVPARVAVAAGNGRRRPRRAVATPDVLHGRGGCEQCDGARRGVRIRTLRCGET